MAKPPGARRVGLRVPSHVVLAAGAVLIGVVLAAVIALAVRGYRDTISEETTRRELLARVLEDHATRTVETASLALVSMSELLASQPHGDATAIGPDLARSLVGLPFLRSVAVLDRLGTVLASTSPDDFGRQVDITQLGSWPRLGTDRLGGYLPGRSLVGLNSGSDAPRAPPGVGFVPLLRSVQMRSGEGLLLIALLNPDAFASYQSQALADEDAAAALVTYGGEILSATPTLGKAPGVRLSDHPVFRRYLPSTEHAGYQGAGVRPGEQVVAFRVSRTRPMVVLVEYPVSAVASAWRQANISFAFVAATTVMFLLAMTVIAWRGMRSREAAQAQLDIAQEEVARREQELSVTVRSVQELIFRTDADGRITFVNDRWRAIGGTAADSVMGKALAELVSPEQRTEVATLFARKRDVGIRAAPSIVVGIEGDQQRHFDIAVVPLLIDGRIAGFAGSAADVTARVQAQQRLETQLTITALMLEVSPLPLSMLDLDGRYVTVNQAWEDFTGRARSDAIGRHAASQLPAEEAVFHEARDRELLAHGGKTRYEARVRHRDGSYRDVVLIKVVVPGDRGEPAGILCVLMDVSEFREAERATREARDAAEETSRAKTEFIANISHELRTPLQSILGFSELGVTRGRQHERLAAMFAEINTSGKRMLALVNDLLDVSKIESTVGTFHLERTDLRPLVREVVHELSPLLAQRDIEVDVRLSEAPLVAKVDPMRFQQVVRNVTANAIKFSPTKSCICIEGETTLSGQIRFSISDQGPGIPAAEIEKVFDAFVQSSITKDGSGGTGLGLAICRKILDAHGGNIYAENRPGGGAMFHITLPARSPFETGVIPVGG